MPSFLPSENTLRLPFFKVFYSLLKCPPLKPFSALIQCPLCAHLDALFVGGSKSAKYFPLRKQAPGAGWCAGRTRETGNTGRADRANSFNTWLVTDDYVAIGDSWWMKSDDSWVMADGCSLIVNGWLVMNDGRWVMSDYNELTMHGWQWIKEWEIIVESWDNRMNKIIVYHILLALYWTFTFTFPVRLALYISIKDISSSQYEDFDRKWKFYFSDILVHFHISDNFDSFFR